MPKSSARRGHHCSSQVCLNVDQGTFPFCEPCAAKLTDDTRAWIGRTFKPGKPQSKRYLAALLKARAEIDYFDRVGRRVPREQPLPLIGVCE